MDYIRLTLRYPRELNEDVNESIANSPAIGSEVSDLQLVDTYQAQAPSWELADIQDLRTQMQANNELLEDDVTLQYVYFEDKQSGSRAMDNLCRHFYEQYGGQIEVPDEAVINNEGWDEEWKKHYEPIEIGQKILVLPAWMDEPETDRTVIRIDPGMAFGTGSHDTTILCLEEIEHIDLAGKSLLDIGCGSGILSIYAKMQGAISVEAVDIDEDALDATKRNADLNGVNIAVYQSDLLSQVDGPYDLIVANLLAGLVIQMLENVDTYLNKGGQLILSGILVEKSPEVQAKLKEVGFTLVEERISEEWAMLRAIRKDEA